MPTAILKLDSFKMWNEIFRYFSLILYASISVLRWSKVLRQEFEAQPLHRREKSFREAFFYYGLKIVRLSGWSNFGLIVVIL